MESVTIDRLPFIDDEAELLKNRLENSGACKDDLLLFLVLLSDARNRAETLRLREDAAIKEFTSTTAALRRENESLLECAHDLEYKLSVVRQLPVLRFIIGEEGPGPIAGRFIEVEDAAGNSVCCGEWSKQEDGTWALTVPSPTGEYEQAKKERDCADKLQSEFERLREWQCRVADEMGYLNRPEGQSGYEIASLERIIAAILEQRAAKFDLEAAQAEIKCLVENEDWLRREVRAARRGQWWCDKCKTVVPKEQVTYEEIHQGCGGECR